MESLNSFRGYGKVSDAEDQDFRRRTCRRIATIAVSAVLLIAIVVTITVGIVLHRANRSTSPNGVADAIRMVCGTTLYPDSCYSSLMAAGANRTGDPVEFFRLSLRISIDRLAVIESLPLKLAAEINDPKTKEALGVCSRMLNDSVEQLNESLSLMQATPREKVLNQFKIEDLKTSISAGLTNYETCLDALENTTNGLWESMGAVMRNSTEFTSNSLAILTHVLDFLDKLEIPSHRKLLGTTESSHEWVTSDPIRGRLLAGLKPDVVVAKDGSGQFKTVSEALALVPKKSNKTFVIYVKAGKYVEQVMVDKKMWNVIMIGDGMNRSIVSGSKNVVDGTPTFNTAPFSVEGKGFMARDMGFENTAGPQKHQAVAARVKADFAVFYRCSFDGYQDTLYTHSFRQFFRECEIRGTVDFIFGNAAAVLQNCTVKPRQPMAEQKNTITAQGKVDPNQNTGLSIQGCKIEPFGTVTAPTFLGRPWKPYSTTVFIESVIGSLVDPKGWLPWDGVNEPGKTIFYGEYRNTGSGSPIMNRVKWAGYKAQLSRQEAGRFTVARFLNGGRWIAAIGVTHQLGLLA